MKQRLDVLLVEKGFFENRTRAKAAIMAGDVYIGGRIYDKAGTMVDVDSEIELKGDTCPFVSRGGMKLEKALNTFVIDLRGAVAMDIGASTGGFTDCMLQRGARKVYAVDVGYGQLDWKLRNDGRVINMEKTNFRYMEPDAISERLDFASMDVSFISLRLIFPAVVKMLKDNACLVCLVKPQFEAGREQVSKGGIVKDPEGHKEVIRLVADYAQDNGLTVYGITYSPMTGAKGNIEYLMMLAMPGCVEEEGIRPGEPEDFAERIEYVVSEAHDKLKK